MRLTKQNRDAIDKVLDERDLTIVNKLYSEDILNQVMDAARDESHKRRQETMKTVLSRLLLIRAGGGITKAQLDAMIGLLELEIS